MARLESVKNFRVIETSAHKSNVEEIQSFLLDQFGIDIKKEMAIEEQKKIDYKLNRPKRIKESNLKWKKKNPEKIRVYGLIQRHRELYPLDDHCFYCGTTVKLEHGHLDYENNGFNYVTVCRSCNGKMVRDKSMVEAGILFLNAKFLQYKEKYYNDLPSKPKTQEEKEKEFDEVLEKLMK